MILDDATSEIYYAQLVEAESTFTVMAGLRAVIERKGMFCALYSDCGAHFWQTPKSGGKVDYERPAQVGRAMKELGVQMIPAYSPQAARPLGTQLRHLAGPASPGDGRSTATHFFIDILPHGMQNCRRSPVAISPFCSTPGTPARIGEPKISSALRSILNGTY